MEPLRRTVYTAPSAKKSREGDMIEVHCDHAIGADPAERSGCQLERRKACA